MDKIKTLIKLHKNNVETTIKELNKLKGSKELMESKLNSLKEEMRIETSKFISTEYGFVLDKYLENSRAAQKKLMSNINVVDQKIENLQVLLHEHFSEQKRFEIILKNREKEYQDNLSFIENKDLAEIS